MTGRATSNRVLLGYAHIHSTAPNHRCDHVQVGGALNVTCAVCGPLRAVQDNADKFIPVFERKKAR